MNKIILFATTAALAVSISVSAAVPASAAPFHHTDPVGAGVAAGIFGFMAGAALAGSARDRGYYYGHYYGSDWRAHVADCQDTYRSYDVRSDTYLGYDGYRHRCEL